MKNIINDLWNIYHQMSEYEEKLSTMISDVTEQCKEYEEGINKVKRKIDSAILGYRNSGTTVSTDHVVRDFEFLKEVLEEATK